MGHGDPGRMLPMYMHACIGSVLKTACVHLYLVFISSGMQFVRSRVLCNISKNMIPLLTPLFSLSLSLSSPFLHLPFSSFLCSSAISVELYYIFATVWGREAYTLYGILLVVFIILISVTACISIALTYFQLSTEDYRWWWRSIFSSG